MRKTILVPTDFSPAALSAADYAFEIAKHTHAKIILLHIYAIPAVGPEYAMTLPIGELEQSAMEGLHNVERKMKARHGNTVPVECKCRSGFVSQEIYTFSVQYNIGLIVMGMRGAGALTEKVIGSVTTDMIRKSVCPVLAIHENTTFKAIKKIMLACDYEELENKRALNYIKELAKVFQSHIYILNVAHEPVGLPDAKHAAAGIKLNHALEELQHSFHSSVNDDVIEGVNAFAEYKQIDMIAMIPHKHSFIGRLLHEPNTKRMAFHSTVPLLALH